MSVGSINDVFVSQLTLDSIGFATWFRIAVVVGVVKWIRSVIEWCQTDSSCRICSHQLLRRIFPLPY